MRQKLLTLIPVLLMLAACAMNPATGRPHFTLVSEDAEYELGHGVVKEAIKADGLYTELPELVNTYREIGAKLVSVSERADKPFDFIIVDSPTFNAWATPGYVNFYRGILPYLNSESELVAIMGHEVGHITARHTVRQMSSSIFTQLLVTGAAIAIAANTDSDALAQGAILAGGVLAGVGLSAYGRGAEYEADELGGRYLERMDYAPAEAANAIRALMFSEKFQKGLYKETFGKDMPESSIYHVFASHPDSGERVKRLEEKYGAPELRSYERAPRLQNDTVGREKYLKLINGLAYGPKKEHGVVTRDRMYMPKDRFMLSVPDGYLATNGMFSESWLLSDVKNNRLMEVSTTQLKRSAGAEEAMRILAPRVRNIRIIELAADVTAAVGEVPRDDKNPKAQGSLVYIVPGANSDQKDKEGNATRRFHLFHFITHERALTDDDRNAFASMMKTYKPLSAAEAERIEPLRIGTYMVRPGDSVASISRNMPFGALREEMFRTLNGMENDADVKPGMLMKVVTDKNTIR